MKKFNYLVLMSLVLALATLPWGVDQAWAQNPTATMGAPFGTPDYFGVPNWANSPLPVIGAGGAVTGGMRKFVDAMPDLKAVIAVPDITTFPGSDYYEISLVEYNQVMHTDLGLANGGLGTKLRGYVQTNGGSGVPSYLGPVILAQKNRPVRIKFTNKLPIGAGGNLFIPTDTTYMGAGLGPDGTPYTQNRATLHLHGGNTPWISDGTPHQWTVPSGEATNFKKGVSTAYVPDMWFDATGALITSCAGQTTCSVAGATNNPGDGSMTFYWTNQQSGRLMFYHDHAYGITRLNVYAGEAAGYLVVDPTGEEDLLAAASVSGTVGSTVATTDLAHLIPLVIQDKTFVPDNGVIGGQLANTDPTWPSPTNCAGSICPPGFGLGSGSGFGNLWFPHVYTPNQNPMDPSGANPFGRWDYGPWFWPIQNPNTLVSPPIACPTNPLILCPGTPNPSGTPEAFMDTMVVNGKAYPTMTVDPAAYRFHILSAGNDRALNLQLYVAEPLSIGLTNPGAGYDPAAPPLPTISSGTATLTAVVSNGTVTNVTMLNKGNGYTAVPNVVIAAPTCTINTTTCVQATATAIISGGSVTGIAVTNGGAGYTAAPLVTIDPSPADLTCSALPTTLCASATATITPGGSLLGITVALPSAFTTAPTVTIPAPPCTINGTTCVQATAIASVNSEVKMVAAAAPLTGAGLPVCAVNTSGGGGMGMPIAVGTPTGLPANCWPSTWPADGRDGGVPDPLTAGPPFVQIGTEGGLLPSPVVIPSTPIGYEYNRRSITVLNIFTHGLLLGPAERADVIVDFSQFAGKTLILYNDAPAPVPAFDPRTDYYTGCPDQTSSGGAPTTLPGYGPNTRTIMQIKVNATGTANAIPFSVASVETALPGIYSGTVAAPNQPAPIVPVGVHANIGDTSIVTTAGPVIAVNLDAGGSGYLTAPTVNILGGGGTGAAATAALAATGSVAKLTLTVGAGATPNSLYTSAPTVGFTGGGGAGAAATAILSGTGGVKSITVQSGGSGYQTPSPTVTIAAPSCTINGTTCIQATATATAKTNGQRNVTSITVTNRGAGYTAAPVVTVAAPPAPGVQATATATFGSVVSSLLLTNGGAGYASAPAVTFSGGGGSGATATAQVGYAVGSITLTINNPLPPAGTGGSGSGYTAVPLVTLTGGGGTGALATAAVGNSMPMLPKAIQELFTLDYGRMNATLGVELPFTNFLTQTTIPYGYVDPPTELFKDGETQVWKITHNGVDTHFIHFHLFDVQVINRVGWDGAVKPPDPNELGWKDTVRMNPLEDIIVALKAMKQTLPWDLPNSTRTLDVTKPAGYTSTLYFTNIDPANQPATTVNDLTNFGWEYVWHCHILGHEENDMMRAMIMAVAPNAPSGLSAIAAGTLSWMDNSLNETSFTIQTAPNVVVNGVNTPGTFTDLVTVPAQPGSGTIVTYKSGALIKNGAWYQVIANNVVGYTRAFAPPVVGYPTISIDSLPSNVVLH